MLIHFFEAASWSISFLILIRIQCCAEVYIWQFLDKWYYGMGDAWKNFFFPRKAQRKIIGKHWPIHLIESIHLYVLCVCNLSHYRPLGYLQNLPLNNLSDKKRIICSRIKILRANIQGFNVMYTWYFNGREYWMVGRWKVRETISKKKSYLSQLF